jgi:hypothetical protein
MAANGTSKGGGLFNVALQVLKFVLLALAVYSMSLSQQLGIKLPATLALVDATPAMQSSQDGKFKVAFYALHFLDDYKQLGLKVFIVKGQEQPQLLTDRKLERKAVPFYSEEVTLPDDLPADIYQFAYEVSFDMKTERTKTTGKSYRIEHDPHVDIACPDISIYVLKGQRAPLPFSWEGMDLIPARSSSGITVESVGGKKWLRARNLNSRTEPYIVEFESLMVVDAKKDLCLTTRNGATQQPGPTVCIDKDTSYFGSITNWSDIVPGDHIAYMGITNSDRSIHATQVSALRGDAAPSSSLSVRLVVVENRPPRSAYAMDTPDEVSLFTSWIFTDNARSMRYLNLNRYIIDPDGRNEKDQPDIRVRQLSMERDDPRFELQQPTNDLPEFRLYFRQDPDQVFRDVSSIQIPLIAQDETNKVSLTLRITKDYIRQ